MDYRLLYQSKLTPYLLLSLALFAAFLPDVARAQPAEPAELPPAQQTESEPPAEEGEGTVNRRNSRSLPLLAEMKVPSAEELLRGERLDWVVLNDEDEHVLVTHPIVPRPDTLNRMQVALEEKLKERKSVSGDDLEKYRQELDEMAHIKLDLPTQIDESIYEIHMDKVSRVIHHEDLMLMRVDKLIQEENFELAYELLNVLRRKDPDWPGAAERHGQFLLAEADRRVKRGQFEQALATIEEIHERNAAFKGVSEAAGSVISTIVSNSIDQQDWRRARHFINRLERMYPGHEVARQLADNLANRAEKLLAEAEQARTEQDHALATTNADLAARIWPDTRNLRTRHRIYADRYQRLHIGVIDLPTSGFGDPVLTSRADRRSAQLQTLQFFHIDNADDGSAHYSSRFCDRWEPLNLGREAVFELRSNRQPWEMQPVVTAPSIAARLARRLDPGDDLYDERLAGYTHSIDVDSPYAFSIHFRRVPVRTEALLTIPVEQDPPAEEFVLGNAGESPVATAVEQPAGGFEIHDVQQDGVTYRRSLPEPEGLRSYHVAEVREHRYPDFDAVFQALLRGEVSMVPDLPPRYIDRLRKDEDLMKALFVEKMALPQTHVIQLNPRSIPLRNREFRRSLVYSIDRETILNRTILDGASPDLGRLVTGPFPSNSYANSALALRRDYDTVSAISLALAARKQLGGELPQLRMVVIDEPLVRAAAEKIVAGWKMFGIDVVIIPPPARLVDPNSESVDWDLLYRTVQMVEPVVELWPFLTLTGRAQVSDLDPFPDWLRQEIINLDLIGDWSEAVLETSRLHLHLWSEVMMLSLWEVDQYLVYRKNIRGVPQSPVKVYDEIDGWIVESWYPSEEP